MTRLRLPATATALVLSLVSPLAQANPPNVVPEKHKAFQDAKTALDGQFRAFVKEVETCAPPVGMADIVKGFTGPQADSAVSALAAHEKSVNDHVAAAESKLAELGDLRSACRAGGFEAKVAAAEAIATEVQQQLAKDMSEYQAGQKVALASENRVRLVLGARLRTGVNMVSTNAQVDGCKKALAILGDDGKNNGPLRDADKGLREKLEALSGGYPQRVAAIRDFGRVLASQSACGGAIQRKAALFPSFRDSGSTDRSGEFQVADIPVDTGAESAR